MGKYIINLRDTTDRIICVGVKDQESYASGVSVSCLTPYTEPDLEQVRKEGYEKGLSDAWKAARWIGSDSRYGLEKMGFKFEPRAVGDDPGWYVVQRYSASECIKRIRLVTILEKMRGEQDG